MAYRNTTRTRAFGSRYNVENARVSAKSTTTTTTTSRTGGVQRRALGDRTNTLGGGGGRAGGRAFKGKSATRVSTSSVENYGRRNSASSRTEKDGGIDVPSTVVPPIQGMSTPEAAMIPHDDIDVDEYNPQACTEYIEDVMSHLRNLELEYLVDPNYMSRQSDISEKFRGILVDWIIQVNLKFKLSQETLYLTVNIIDRFLARKQIARSKLQLVGITAMLVAAKYEEIYPPEIRDLVTVSDNAYTKKEVLKMEQLILATLDFRLLCPYPIHFLRRYSKACRNDIRYHTLAKYFIDLTLTDYSCIQFLPSTIAAAALCLALRVSGRSTWTETLEHYSHYTEASLEPCIEAIAALHRAQVNPTRDTLTFVYEKYSHKKYMEVSKLAADADI